MNCRRCHHAEIAHELCSNNSLKRAGVCLIPHCTCSQYLDVIEEIDEDLL